MVVGRDGCPYPVPSLDQLLHPVAAGNCHQLGDERRQIHDSLTGDLARNEVIKQTKFHGNLQPVKGASASTQGPWKRLINVSVREGLSGSRGRPSQPICSM